MKTVGILLDIKHLAAEGLSKSQIARCLSMDRGTVAKYLAEECSFLQSLQAKPVVINAEV